MWELYSCQESILHNHARFLRFARFPVNWHRSYHEATTSRVKGSHLPNNTFSKYSNLPTRALTPYTSLICVPPSNGWQPHKWTTIFGFLSPIFKRSIKSKEKYPGLITLTHRFITPEFPCCRVQLSLFWVKAFASSNAPGNYPKYAVCRKCGPRENWIV